MYPTSPSSILLHPAHFNFHQPLCNTLNVIRTKISHEIGQFRQILGEKLKLLILTENWHIRYVGGADSESRRRFLKFRPQNPFWRKFAPKKSKFSFLLENWHKWYLDDANYTNKQTRTFNRWPSGLLSIQQMWVALL